MSYKEYHCFTLGHKFSNQTEVIISAALVLFFELTRNLHYYPHLWAAKAKELMRSAMYP